MKWLPTRAAYLVLLPSLLIQAPSADPPKATFEGTLQIRRVKGKERQEFSLASKARRIRTELIGSPKDESVQIFDLEKKKQLWLMMKAKMGMEMSPSVVGALEEGAKKKEAEFGARARPTKTDKTKKILDRNCEQWILKDEKGSQEIWLADGFGTAFPNYLGWARLTDDDPFGPRLGAWEKEIGEQGKFPMSWVEKDAKGKTLLQLDVVKVKPGPLKDSFFEIPEGFTVASMSADEEKE